MNAVRTTGPDALTDAALARALDLLPDVVLVVDEAGTVLLANQQLGPVLGYAPEEVVGRPVERLMPERFRGGHAGQRQAYGRAPATRAMGTGLDLYALKADGTEVPVDVGLSPMLTENGVRVLTVLRDVSERKRLLELEKRLAHADRLIAVGQLAAGVAHEINNPAGYVMANLTAAGDLIDELQEAVNLGEGFHVEALIEVLRDLMLQNLDGMNRIRRFVGELQGFSRIEGSGVEQVDLRDVVEAGARIVRNEVKHKGRLELDLEEVPRMVADGARLGQVVVDLLVNAVHALPEGRHDENLIRVTLRRDGDAAVLEVADNGVGLDEETKKRVFEPFFTTKAPGVGTGLGLALVADIVHKHGGEVYADGAPGEGARMTVRLPLETNLTPDAPETAPPEPTKDVSGKILLVDDEPHMLEAFKRLLGRDHDVTGVRSVDEALDALFREGGYDVVLCDLMMPGRDGIALHDHLAQKAPELLPRLVFTTGGAFTARAREFLSRGEHRVLRKPVDVAELRAVIAEVIQQGR